MEAIVVALYSIWILGIGVLLGYGVTIHAFDDMDGWLMYLWAAAIIALWPASMIVLGSWHLFGDDADVA